MAVTGRVGLLAAQEVEDGQVVAEHVQSVTLPTSPDRFILDELRVGVRLAIVGFEPNLRVPVGLYRIDTPGDASGPLVRQVAVVRIPRSRVFVFEIPRAVLAEMKADPKLCITVPLEDQYNCPYFSADKAPAPAKE